jgi:hypothetical protein
MIEGAEEPFAVVSSPPPPSSSLVPSHARSIDERRRSPQVATEDPRQDAHLRVVVQRDLLVGPKDEDACGVLVGGLGDATWRYLEGPPNTRPRMFSEEF